MAHIKKGGFGRWLEKYAALLFASFLLLLWQVLVPLAGLSEFVLPTPISIASRFYRDFHLLGSNAIVTSAEVLAGFCLAVLIAIPLALAIFYSRTFERAVYPILVALQTVPKVSLAPLLVLYLGYGWAPKIWLAFLISLFPIVISTVVGLNALDKNLVSLVRSMGANEWQTFCKVRLPAALPSIFGGFKVAVSLAVIGSIIGEYVAAERGLGYLQLQANAQFDTTLNFATVVAISGLGVIFYYIVDFIESRVVYKRDSAL
ncbi:MAG: ABC transporter permease [Rhizobiales bacterium]|nr:ABC transporter permease [Hyphomicrobiales bacterium]